MAKRHHSGARHHMKAGVTEMHQEQKEGAMIGNEHSKFANLPTEVMMKAYPRPEVYMDFDMEDNIRGIDKQMSDDNSKRRSGMSPHKY